MNGAESGRTTAVDPPASGTQFRLATVRAPAGLIQISAPPDAVRH